MARPLRIEYPGASYHVTARGNEKRVIFRTSRDYDVFLSYLVSNLAQFDVRLMAYALMPNHYHLLLVTGRPNLSRFMHQVNTSYTVYFNRKHRRIGHLFQGRYHAVIVQENVHLLEASRYVHLNAYRAGLVDRPERYRHSSLGYYVGLKPVPSWLSIDMVIRILSERRPAGLVQYQAFVRDRMDAADSPFAGMPVKTIVGDRAFIEAVWKRGVVREDPEVPDSKRLAQDINVAAVLQAVSEHFGIAVDQLFAGRRGNIQRKIAVYLLRSKTSATLKDIGVHFGLTYSAVTHIKKTVDMAMRRQPELNQTVMAIERRIHALQLRPGMEVQISRPDPNAR